MKLSRILFLSVSCLLLAGCNEVDLRGTGPVGRSAPSTMANSEHNRLPDRQQQGTLPFERPIRRQRRKAECGRSVTPGENAVGFSSPSSGLWGDFPAWLDEARKYDGLYAGHGNMTVDIANPVIVGDPAYNEFGENKMLVRMWNFVLTGAGSGLLERRYRIYDKQALWGGVFAHWCLMHAENPDNDLPYQSVTGNAADAALWLDFGEASEPVIGAIMVVEREGRLHVTFCVGAIFSEPDKGDGPMTRLYLAFGGDENNRVGLAAYDARSVQAFRLPTGYVPGKDLFALEKSPWVERFKREWHEGASHIRQIGGTPVRALPGKNTI